MCTGRPRDSCDSPHCHSHLTVGIRTSPAVAPGIPVSSTRNSAHTLLSEKLGVELGKQRYFYILATPSILWEFPSDFVSEVLHLSAKI